MKALSGMVTAVPPFSVWREAGSRAPGRRRQNAFGKALSEDSPSAQNGLAAETAIDYHELDHPP